jgi:hypothetical protein
MTQDAATALVLEDEAGNYFILPQEILERGRVPEEHEAEVRRLIADSDVSGYRDLQPHHLVTHAVWAAELVATTVGKVLANAYFEAAYGSRGSPSGPA